MTPEAVVTFLGESLDGGSLPEGPLTLLPGVVCRNVEVGVRSVLRRVELVARASAPYRKAVNQDALCLATAIKEASA